MKNRPRTDPRRQAKRALIASLAAQAVYALQLYFFFTYPGGAFNRMLVILECLFPTTFSFLFVHTYLRPVLEMVGRRFLFVSSAAVTLLALGADFLLRSRATTLVDETVLFSMLLVESLLLLTLTVSLRAWAAARRMTGDCASPPSHDA